MEQNKAGNRKLSALIAGVLVVCAIAAVATVTLLMRATNTNENPGLYFKGIRLQPVVMDTPGGPVETVQALVDIYVEDVDKLTSIQFDLDYNSEYLTPSSVTTNQILTRSSPEYDFFSVPDSLYEGKNPYYPISATSTLLGHGTAYVHEAQLRLYLYLQEMDTDSESSWPEAGKIKRLFHAEDAAEEGEEDEDEEGSVEGGGSDQKISLYIDATTETHVITLSFQVNIDKLPEMLMEFSGKVSPNGVVNGKYPIRLNTMSQPTTLMYWNTPDNASPKALPIRADMNPEFTIKFQWDIPERPVILHSNEKNVTVNAFQAYTDGTVADLAATLQRYSPTARAKYTSGREEDVLLYWGGDDGCFLTNGDGEQRLFRWTKDVAGNYDGGYDFLEWDGTADAWVPANEADWYDPTGGSYVAEQYVDYPWAGGVRRYEYPVEVHLTVTPVTLTGITATDLYKVYPNNDALPQSYDGLDLPSEAILSTDVVCGSGNLTMDIDDWDPAYTTDMTTITGLKAGVDGIPVVPNVTVTWLPATDDANVGVYTFDADPVFTKAAIQPVYPWLTVTGDRTLTATRQIVSEDDFVDIDLFRVTGYRGDGMGNPGSLTLEIRKLEEDGSSQVDMVLGSTFRVKLPDGTVIDPNWFSEGGSALGTYRVTRVTPVGEKAIYQIQFKADPTGTSDPVKRTKHELVQRYINLGGYFYVAITEPGKAETDFLPAYIAPRENVYTRSYNDMERPIFDFTGDKKLLLPFYRNMQLPTTVVLPYGDDYKVATLYDGMTGAEPGAIHTVVVDTWNPVSASAGASWATTHWTGPTPILVQYGVNPFAGEAQITGFGKVYNTNAKTVGIKVEVLDEDAPQQELRLTYEETGASVSLLANNEVDQVTFDPRVVGYPDTQLVTLTLTNVGTTDIHGLYIDTAAAGGAFQVKVPPATELPAGAKTTFVLSYQLNLGAGIYQANATTTPLKVYSASGSVDPATGTVEPLKTFKAYLKVTEDPLWRVKVQSSDLNRGTGRLVMGDVGGTLDDTAGPSLHLEGEDVWVLAEPKGEYAVDYAYYYDKAAGADVNIPVYTSVPTSDGKVLFHFEMPRQNVIVHVVFKEPVYAKLRLKMLEVDAGPDDSSLTWKLPLRKADDYTIVQSSTSETPEFYDRDYLVIIPAEDARTRLKVELRDVLRDIPKVFVDVKIVLNYEGALDTDVQIYEHIHTAAETDPKLVHETVPFASPQPGRYVLATITLKSEEDGAPVTRTYTVKIARRPSDEYPAEYPLSPGNSPYGMIEGDSTITDKAAAKAAYNLENRFAANTVDAVSGDPIINMPTRATTLTNTYWTEAWSGVNYDRDPSALFVYLGEAFDDAGPELVLNSARDEIELKDVTRTVEVVLLDAAGTTQAQEFGGATKVTLDLGTADVVTVDNWWIGTDGTDHEGKIRPGVYKIAYSFVDADGATLSFYRPLIVLSRNGDVDLNGATESSDAEMIENREGSPLGISFVDGKVFLYRVCDVNNDRNLNNIDADAVRGGKSVIFYLPTSYSDVTEAAHNP